MRVIAAYESRARETRAFFARQARHSTSARHRTPRTVLTKCVCLFFGSCSKQHAAETEASLDGRFAAAAMNAFFDGAAVRTCLDAVLPFYLWHIAIKCGAMRSTCKCTFCSAFPKQILDFFCCDAFVITGVGIGALLIIKANTQRTADADDARHAKRETPKHSRSIYYLMKPHSGECCVVGHSTARATRKT